MTSPRPIHARLQGYFHPQLDLRGTVWILFCFCFLSGLVDAVGYAAWESFIAMQTGNTLFLGLAASQQPTGSNFTWPKHLAAIGCFSLGSLYFVTLQRHLGSGPRSRLAMIASIVSQIFVSVISASVVSAGLVPVPKGLATPSDLYPNSPLWMEILPLSLLSFEMAGQLAMSKALQRPEVNTLVVTSSYADIATDPFLFKLHNTPRNNRVMGVLLIFSGAVAGGWVLRSEGGMGATLWFSVGVKALVGIAILLWREETKEGEGEKEKETGREKV